MGTGSVGLIWYFACLLFCGFVFSVAAGLYWVGKRRERARIDATVRKDA